MNIKDMVKDKLVLFKYYHQGNLWYETEDGFIFPVPVEDTGGGKFGREDKAILFMRWIKRYMDEMKLELKGDL